MEQRGGHCRYAVHLLLLFSQVLNQKICKLALSVEQLAIASHLSDCARLHHHNLVHLLEEADPVGHQHAGLVAQQTLRSDDLLKDVLAHMGVHSGQGVVK